MAIEDDPFDTKPKAEADSPARTPEPREPRPALQRGLIAVIVAIAALSLIYVVYRLTQSPPPPTIEEPAAATTEGSGDQATPDAAGPNQPPGDDAAPASDLSNTPYSLTPSSPQTQLPAPPTDTTPPANGAFSDTPN